jgi:hypothetical protein
MVVRRYPEITSPCPVGMSMACTQKSGWCAHCCRDVHNLDALDERELKQLMQRSTSLCVRYSVRVPMALALAGGSVTALAAGADAMAVDLDSDTVQMETVEMTGGIGAQREAWESLFQELEVPENLRQPTEPGTAKSAGEAP